MANTLSKMLPADTDFDKVAYTNSALKWADLSPGKYIIEGRRELTTQHGDAMILTLRPFDGVDVCGNMSETVEVWACDRLVTQLQDKPGAKHIRNNGMKVSQKNKTHKYHSFNLL